LGYLFNNLKTKKMKRLLFIVVLGFAVVQFANAQVIELIGQGVLGVNPSTILIPDNGPVEKVTVVAAAVFYNSAVPADVTFSDADETYTVSFIETNPQLAPPFILNDPALAFGYYTATFNTVDVSGIELENYGQELYVVSFTAYVYRTGDAPGIFSDVQGPHAYLFRLGSEVPLEYTYTIPASVSPRDVVITLPFSHLHSSNLRPANVKVTAGAIIVESEFEENNSGALLHLETVTLEDLPGDVTEVKVTIWSQTIAETADGDGGGSFITGPGLLVTTFEEGVCTLTQGYWKTHSEYGPAPYDATWAELADGADTEFFSSGMTYYEVLWTAPAGNPYYILAHQYIAAELNILAEASDEAVSSEMAAAKALLETYTPAQVMAMSNNSAVKKSFTSLAGTLDKYNNGEIGPGHCDDEEFELMEKSAQIINSDIRISELSVYPNPVINTATVSFTPAFDDIATVDLYNSLGQRTSRLMHQSVAKDIPVSLTFDARQFNEGLYILMIQNGPGRESVKIQISR
jgi:hypothetical protein